jgi:DHA3 family macrolide efflux protein-like MFS transporter
MATTSQKHLISRWQRPFFIIWVGQAFSLLGSSLAGFALVWWLTDTSGLATVLAFGTLMQILPQIILGPILGALVDRWNRRLVMLASDSTIAIFSLGLASLLFLERGQVWHIYAILFVRALCGVFHLLAMQASTPLMVPEEQLGRVAGVNQTLQGAMNILTPVLGALLLGLIPIQYILLIDVGTALLAVVPLIFIPIPHPTHSMSASIDGEPGEPTSFGQELKSGLVYVWNWPGLRGLILMATISNFMTIPAMSFIPLVVTKNFGLGVLEVGWMGTVQGIGLLVGGILLTAWGGFKKKMLTVLPAVMLMGVGLAQIGLAPANLFVIALAGNLIFATMRPIIDGSTFAMLQAIIPPEKQGRVLSIILSGSASSAFGGLLIAGPIVDATSLRLWFVLAGVVAIIIGLSGFFIPAIFSLEDRRNLEISGNVLVGSPERKFS